MPSGVFSLKQVNQALVAGAWSNQKPVNVDYLVVAGGGGAGASDPGGGGGGGVVQGNISVVPNSSYTVTIGAGGAGRSGGTIPGSGNNSVFGNIAAIGGGYGGTGGTPGGNGGSGGGGGSGNAVATVFGQGSFGQGNRGGTGSFNAGSGTAGGGGAGTAGLDNVGSAGGAGGVGVFSTISGSRNGYGGGGGGSGTAGGLGGAGGGGAGATGTNGVSGTANTGGGGGGAPNYTGGSGGSGIVILSYPDIYAAPAATTGSPTVSTSGSGAISFSGSGQFLQYADNAAFDVGSGNFTIEAWVYRLANGRMFVCGQGDSSGSDVSGAFSISVNASDLLTANVNSGGTIYTTSQTTTFSNNTWVHVAFVRDGNTGRLYSNGIQVGTINLTGVTVNNSANRVGIGSAGEYIAAFLWNGYITNFRFVKGTCLYPNGTTFTPSTIPLTAISGTSLLLSANSGSFSADSSANGFFPVASNNSPTWTSASPFATGLGYKNRVYTWTSSGSITF